MKAIMSFFFQTEGTCLFAFKEVWTDREVNSAEANLSSEAGFCMRNRAPIGLGKTDRKREIEQEREHKSKCMSTFSS